MWVKYIRADLRHGTSIKTRFASGPVQLYQAYITQKYRLKYQTKMLENNP